MERLAGLAALIALASSSACTGPSSSSRGHGPPGATIAIAGGTLTYGFTITRPRTQVSVGAFRIGRYPVTVAEYSGCVEAGACTAPALPTDACQTEVAGGIPVAGPTYGAAAEAASLPVTCARPVQAIAYCAWVGGSLATAEQWLYAARGPTVQRYPWGDSPPTCKQHPGAASCTPSDVSYLVKSHEPGAGASGMQDVLLARNELLRGARGSLAAGCGSDDAACLVGSASPGAIDSAWAIDTAGDQPFMTEQPYAFRCAWEDGQ